jgi:predicted nucleic acid-binding protein
MLLIETSVWVNHFRGVQRIPDAFSIEPLATAPPILQEVLNGSDSPASYAKARIALTSFVMLDDPMPLDRFEAAANIYLQCREAGYTIRSSVDCLIAACAIAHDATLLHNDRDFDFIAKVSALRARRLTPSRS